MFLLLFIPLVVGVEELTFSSTIIEHFEVEFETGVTNFDKHYFLFEDSADNWTFATFERKEKQYELILANNQAHEIYTAPVVDDELIFSWPDYLINGIQMTLVLKQGDLDVDDVDTYRFLSSVLSFSPLGTPKVESVYSCEEVCRYYYLLIPVVVCAFGSRFDLFLKLYQKYHRIPIETEELEETTV